MADTGKVARKVGSTISKCGVFIGKNAAKGGRFVGRKIKEGWDAIDPDVKRTFAQLPLLSYTLFVSRREEINPGKPDGHPPLIFVHGLGGDRGNFLPMALYLRHRGRKRSYRINFNCDQSIEEMAQALATFITDVKKATGQKKVEVVAHSLGGIVARLALNDYGAARSVKTMITLGSPHSGTFPARYAVAKKILPLRVDSELVRRLNGKPWPRSVRGVTFWSKNDIYIVPPESARLKGTEQIDMTPFTHFSYLIDPRSWAAVATTLGCK